MSNNSSASSPSAAQVARFIAAQERHQRLKSSIESGAAAKEIGPGSPAPAGDTSTSASSCMNGGLDLDLFERLARLATTPPAPNRPPLVTYTTTPGPYGDVVSATAEYVRWFVSNYPSAGGGDPVQRRGPLPAASEVGGGTELDDSDF